MSSEARRRRAAAKRNPYRDAVLAPRQPPAGCMARCLDCLTRCMSPVDTDGEHEHWFACDCG